MVKKRSQTKNVTVLPIAISALALCVSIGATVVSYLSLQQSKKFNEISVQPILHTGGPFFQEPESYSFVANRGSGAAFIESGGFFFRGKNIQGSSISEIFESYQDEFNALHDTDFTCSIESGMFYKDMLIEPDQRVTLFHTTGGCPSEMYLPFLQEVGFEVTYRSLSGLTQGLRFGAAQSEEGLGIF